MAYAAAATGSETCGMDRSPQGNSSANSSAGARLVLGWALST
jgi:hypothetical protein